MLLCVFQTSPSSVGSRVPARFFRSVSRQRGAAPQPRYEALFGRGSGKPRQAGQERDSHAPCGILSHRSPLRRSLLCDPQQSCTEWILVFMLCCSDSPQKPSISPPLAEEQSSVDLSKESLAPKGSSLRRLAAIGGLLMAPHALCVLGGVGALGSGLSYLRWCHHSTEAILSSVSLPQIPKLPENLQEFPAEVSQLAARTLFEIEPRFHAVLARKQEQAGTEPVLIVFLEDNDTGRVSVVFCKNGSLCPCSEPALYEVGDKRSLLQPERYRGQHELLRLLYGRS